MELVKMISALEPFLTCEAQPNGAAAVVMKFSGEGALAKAQVLHAAICAGVKAERELVQHNAEIADRLVKSMRRPETPELW